LSKNLTASERKIIEDFRSRSAQRKATRVTRSGIDPNERLRLAKQQQAKTDALRAQAENEAARQNLIAKQKAEQSRQRAQQIAQQKKSKADRGFVQTTTGSGKTISVSQSTAERLAERIRASEKAKQISQQKQNEQILDKPIDLNSFVKSQKKPRKRGSQFGQQTSRGSIGQQVSMLEPPIIRGLTDEQRKAPQFLGGKVKSLLTEDKKERFSFGGLIPSIPEARAEEFPESQNIPRKENFIPFQSKKPEPKIQRVKVGDKFISVIPNPNAGRVVTRNPDGTPKEVESAFTRVSGSLGGVQEQERPPVSKNFIEGFFAGSKQELVNTGNIADIVTGKEGTFGKTRKEVGSTITDLPFSVGGALLTKEAEAGKGFAGLGFDFDVNVDRALKKSGEEQKFITEEFQRDPARAIGSTFTAVGTEVALIVGTGGSATVARKGIVKTSQFIAKSKNFKKAIKIANELDRKLGEKNVSFTVEEIAGSKGTQFEIIRGTEALGDKAIKVISPSKGVITQLTKKGKIITKQIPIIKGITRKAGQKGTLNPTKASIKAGVTSGKDSKLPLTVIEFSGKKGGDKPLTTFFPKEIPRKTGLSTTNKVVLEGVDVGQFGGKTGLKTGTGKSLQVIGKPSSGIRGELEVLEDTGFVKVGARGIQFATEDVTKNPELFAKLALSGKTKIPTPKGQATQIGKAPIQSPLRVSTFDIILTKAEGFEEKAMRLGGKGSKVSSGIKKFKPTVGGKGSKIIDDSKATKLFAETKPVADITKIRQVIKDTIGATSKTKPKNIRTGIVGKGAKQGTKSVDDIISATSLGARIGVGVSSGSMLGSGQQQKSKDTTVFDFGNVLVPQTGSETIKEKKTEIITVFPNTKPIVDTTPREDIGVIVKPITTPITDEITTPIINFNTPSVPTPPPIPRGGGIIPPIDQFRKLNQDRKRKKSKQGKRLFDVAETPFGKVEVGLGFFIEQKGEETIAEAIGTAQKNGKKKKKAPIDNVFDPTNLFQT